MQLRSQLRLGPLLLLGAASCNDAPQRSILVPDEPSALVAPIVANGDPTYYKSGVQTTYSGGYTGYGRSDAKRSEKYVEELTWSSADRFWNVNLSFPSGYRTLNSTYTPTVDVANAVITKTSSSVRDRSGNQILSTSGDVPLDHQGKDPNVPVSYSKSASAPLPLRNANVTLDASAASEPVDRTAALDRRVITPAGTQRALVRLRKSFRESAEKGGQISFTEVRGNTEVRVTFKLNRPEFLGELVS